ncbi:hypothetical protein [Flavobacterium undicola]|nr:hypothetical protein [Flavobacterium undicola]MBA0885070.1 hypothetical protein [Flavobacterium undicola]
MLNPLERLKIFYQKTHSCGMTAVPFNTGFIVGATHATKPLLLAVGLSR